MRKTRKNAQSTLHKPAFIYMQLRKACVKTRKKSIKKSQGLPHQFRRQGLGHQGRPGGNLRPPPGGRHGGAQELLPRLQGDSRRQRGPARLRHGGQLPPGAGARSHGRGRRQERTRNQPGRRVPVYT